LIVGLAVNGFGKETFEHFQEMEREELVPSGITFVGILYMLLVIAVRLMRGLNTSKGSMDRGI
jgi:hypothetical protein